MHWGDIVGIVGTAILSIGTAGGIVVALSGWLGKVWANRILENERAALQKELEAFRAQSGRALEQHKYSLGKFSLVHKLQFEKEFSVYQELWNLIVELRGAAVSLRPALDSADSTAREEVERRLKRVSEAFRNCGTAIERNRPFYHQSIYALAAELLGLAQKEALEYDGGRHWGVPDYYTRALENAKAIFGVTDRICDEVRKRITSLEVPVATERGNVEAAP